MNSDTGYYKEKQRSLFFTRGFVFAVFACFLYSSACATWAVTGGNLLSAGAVTPTTSAQNSSVSAASVNGKAPYWSFSGVAGTTYHFNLCSSTTTSDCLLAVYSGAAPGGNLSAANDDYCGIKPGMTFICPVTQTYYICADVSTGLSPFTFGNSGTVVLTYYSCGSVSSVTPPVSENWSGATVLTTACTGWMAQGAGSEGDWWISSTTNAGGTSPELDLYGNQANMYGVGVTKVMTMTTYPINTLGVATMTFNWKHTLNLSGNSGASGSNTVVIKLQSSSDLINWTDQYSATYTVTGSAATPINKVPQSVTMSLNSQRTWLRFYMSAVPFKIIDWYIDNGTSTVTLPIELAAFKGEETGDGIQLNWKTASETNNDHFTIERSVDGTNFSPLAIIPGAGNSNQSLNYLWLDESPMEGINYYRLKQSDFNSDFSYSDVIAIEFTREGKWVSAVFPNPAENETGFTIYSSSASYAGIEVADITGRIVKEESYPVNEGWQHIKFSMEELNKGMYYLHISLKGTKRTSTVKISKE